MNKKLRSILPIGTGIALIAAGAAMMIKASVPYYDRTYFAMDCPCEIKIYSKEDYTGELGDRITELDETLSAYYERSEITRLNSCGKLEKAGNDRHSHLLNTSRICYQYIYNDYCKNKK